MFTQPYTQNLAGTQNYGNPGQAGFAPTVRNTSQDLVTNDQPTVLVFPYSHVPELNPDREANHGANCFKAGDLCFVLRNSPEFTRLNYKPRFDRLSGNEIALATIQTVNQILLAQAQQSTDAQGWWSDPERVAEWAVPYGVILQPMQMSTLGGGGNSGIRRDRNAYNVQVSRRVNMKDSFISATYPLDNSRCPSSTQQVGVQYSREEACVRDNEAAKPVVMLSTLYFDEMDIGEAVWKHQNCKTVAPVTISFEHGGKPSVTPNEMQHFVKLENTTDNFFMISAIRKHTQDEGSVIVPLGRILHSPPRPSSFEECMNAYFNKYKYDQLGPIEVELGCP